MTARKVLVIGAGGREHALCRALEASPSVSEVLALPGNAGIQTQWTCIDAKPSDHRAVVQAVRTHRVDLVIVGPEAPLVAGLVDTLRSGGVAAFGPTQKAARLEGSKVFMKRFAQEHDVPTAPFQVFTSPTPARTYVRKLDRPPVIKADGLCSGKGVVVADSIPDALSAVDAILERRAFGEAGAAIVVEEHLEGQEVSVQAMCDGENFVLLPAAQDHKRVADGDKGLNTGGMGAYAPAPLCDALLEKKICDRILEPTLRGMRSAGHPFRGVLYAGVMVTPAGDPYLLEFNVRFGDPEAQVTLPLLEGDFAQACYACATGRLAGSALSSNGRHALCVVLASHGYPEAVRTGDRIQGLEEATKMDDVVVFHAGTSRLGNDLVTSGGRVFGVVGLAADLRTARDRAYAACGKIHFDGMHFRKDIGARALG